MPLCHAILRLTFLLRHEFLGAYAGHKQSPVHTSLLHTQHQHCISPWLLGESWCPHVYLGRGGRQNIAWQTNYGTYFIKTGFCHTGHAEDLTSKKTCSQHARSVTFQIHLQLIAVDCIARAGIETFKVGYRESTECSKSQALLRLCMDT